MRHVPVLLEEAISVLALRGDSVVVDATLGSGGHARRILEKLGTSGVLVGIDADPVAIEGAADLKQSRATVHLVNQNFSTIKNILSGLSLTPDAILADLGWRTEQFESGGKGFSFRQDEPLLMTFGDPKYHTFTATDIVNEWEEESITDVIYGYGEERFSRRIAKAIVEARQNGVIKTSGQLAEIVSNALPGKAKAGRIHPATRTFQALRIAVNDELGVLNKLLHDGFEVLGQKGRFAIISFHSLEDRIVKRFFQDKVREGNAVRLIKKPIIASDAERESNPRARSAKLRVIEKL